MGKSIFYSGIALLLSAAILLGLNFGLSNIRQANEKAELLAKMQTILPGSQTFTEESYDGDDLTIRSVYKGETGYVIATETQGYAGTIAMLIGVSEKGVVTGLQIRDMEETFGLGGNALTDWKFLSQFLNTDGNAEIGTNIDAITGATVTSKAVTRSIHSAVAFVTGSDISSGATSWGG